MHVDVFGEERRPLTPARRAEILHVNETLAGEALRTLGVAARWLPEGTLPRDEEPRPRPALSGCRLSVIISEFELRSSNFDVRRAKRGAKRARQESNFLSVPRGAPPPLGLSTSGRPSDCPSGRRRAQSRPGFVEFEVRSSEFEVRRARLRSSSYGAAS